MITTFFRFTSPNTGQELVSLIHFRVSPHKANTKTASMELTYTTEKCYLTTNTFLLFARYTNKTTSTCAVSFLCWSPTIDVIRCWTQISVVIYVNNISIRAHISSETRFFSNFLLRHRVNMTRHDKLNSKDLLDVVFAQAFRICVRVCSSRCMCVANGYVLTFWWRVRINWRIKCIW